MKKYLLLLAAGLISMGNAVGQSLPIGANYEFTNYVELQSCKFRLWVPPTTQKVKGVVVAFTQMQEWVSLDTNLREACMLEDLAILWADKLSENDYPKLEAGLNALAESSGMPELKTVPFATMAHSTAGIFCRTMATQKPERCFAIVQLNAVDFRNNEVLKDVPWLVIKNGSEETDDTWEQASYFLVNDKESYKNPDGSSSGDDKAWTSPRGNGCHIALVSLPGQGHFGWSPQESKLVSTFIAKAAHYQLKSDDGTITRVPESEGWLTDTAIQTEPEHQPAAFADYSGEAAKAFWHIDEEMATLWTDIHVSEMSKASQTVTQTTFNTTSVWQPAGNMNLSNGGVTAAYPVDVASSVEGNPIKVKTYYGVFKVVNGTDLYYSPARYGFTSQKDWITFYQEGTETERYAETTTGQVGATGFPSATNFTLTAISDKNITDGSIDYNVSGETDDWVVTGNVYHADGKWQIDGYTSVPKTQVYIRHAGGTHNNLKETKFNITNSRKAQTITFDSSVPEQVFSGKPQPVSLSATSTGKDATISYYLLSGPATIEGNVLTTTGEEGNIRVLAIAQNKENNPAKAELEITVVKDPSGVIGYETDSVKVYPTLVDDIVTVANAAEGALIRVYDVNGRQILSEKSNGAIVNIYFGDKANGMYFLTVDGRQTTKLIKK